jgi:hypothetical protein
MQVPCLNDHAAFVSFLEHRIQEFRVQQPALTLAEPSDALRRLHAGAH